MKYFIKKIFILIFIFFLSSQSLFSQDIYFIDYTKVLNQSIAGAEAQKKLKTKFENENKKFSNQEEQIKKEESDLISQKKALSQEEYKKKIDNLRKKVSDLQVNKQNSLSSIAKSRNDARQELLKAVNPILKKYMEDNGISLIIDKQSIILADVKFEITDNIIQILNNQVKSIKVD